MSQPNAQPPVLPGEQAQGGGLSERNIALLGELFEHAGVGREYRLCINCGRQRSQFHRTAWFRCTVRCILCMLVHRSGEHVHKHEFCPTMVEFSAFFTRDWFREHAHLQGNLPWEYAGWRLMDMMCEAAGYWKHAPVPSTRTGTSGRKLQARSSRDPAPRTQAGVLEQQALPRPWPYGSDPQTQAPPPMQATQATPIKPEPEDELATPIKREPEDATEDNVMGSVPLMRSDDMSSRIMDLEQQMAALRQMISDQQQTIAWLVSLSTAQGGQPPMPQMDMSENPDDRYRRSR